MSVNYEYLKQCLRDMGRDWVEDKLADDDGEDKLNSACACDIEPENIDEAYAGTFRDDEEFAQNMAGFVGAIKDDIGWPYDCIDWGMVVRELMFDYCEDGGFYFRVM
jgi:hypothetical protein